MYHGERFNSITHLLGTVLAVSGSVVVIADAARGGDPWKIVSFSVFGTMLVVLYAEFTLYHSISATRAKAVFRRLDHAAIYLLIAGTYTPFTLVTLRGALGWTLFATIWTMALSASCAPGAAAAMKIRPYGPMWSWAGLQSSQRSVGHPTRR